MFNKYNFLGDTHGRPHWKDLVIDDGKNIFLGDYFSPYNNAYSYEQCKENFLQIIDYKLKHPETELLVGNHDEDHWNLLGETRVSRHDWKNDKEIKQIFDEYRDLFKMAVSIDNKYIVTHAGVTMPWYCNAIKQDYFNLLSVDKKPDGTYYDTIEEAIEAYKKHNNLITGLGVVVLNAVFFFKNQWYEYSEDKIKLIEIPTPDELAKTINELWKKDPKEFSFERCADYFDTCGNSVTQSPVWVRPEELLRANIYRASDNYHQIVGHTMFKDISQYSNTRWSEEKQKYVEDPRETKEVIFVDCLQTTKNSYIISKQ